MLNLEQVKLLESKVIKTTEFIKRVLEDKKRLETTLESYQKRIEELEVLVHRFKEDREKIEAGILASLDRLNQFEDAIEKSLAGGPEPEAAPAPAPVETGADIPAEPEEKEGGDSLHIEIEEPEEEPDMLEEDSGEAELDIF